jgi:tetratricopeptide (TPR) repeat protein
MSIDNFSNLNYEHLPYPLAVNCKKHNDANIGDPKERNKLIIELFEVLIKFTASISAKSYLVDGATDDKFRRRLKEFKKASLGHWVDLLRASLKPYEHLKRNEIINHIFNWYNCKIGQDVNIKNAILTINHIKPEIEVPKGKLCIFSLFDLLTNVRNKIGHGAQNSKTENQELHSALTVIMNKILEKLDFYTSFPIFFIDEVKYSSGLHHLNSWIAAASETEFSRKTLTSAAAIQDKRLYIGSFDNEQRLSFALDLSPYMICQHCPHCKMKQIFCYNSTKNRSIEYLSYKCGHQISLDSPENDFHGIEQLLEGKIQIEDFFKDKVIGENIIFDSVHRQLSSRERLDSEKRYNLGIEMLNQGMVNEAVRLFSEAEQINKDSAKIKYMYGLSLLFDIYNATDIIKIFNQACILNPDSGKSHYALGRFYLLLDMFISAKKHIEKAISLDPSNQYYRDSLRLLPDIETEETQNNIIEILPDNKKKDAEELAKELLTKADNVLPEIRWWVTAIPPWRFIRKSPITGSLSTAIICFVILLLTNINDLNSFDMLSALAISCVIFMGLIVPLATTDFLTILYKKLQSTVTLPTNVYKRWFLSEVSKFAGCYHNLGEKNYGLRSVIKHDRFNVILFALFFISIFPFQFACAYGMDPFKFEVLSIIRYIIYFFEVYCLSWIGSYVINAILIIPSFVSLPVRYFISMPDSVSLKPLGTFYLKVSTLATITYLFFSFQHYIFRTHEHFLFLSVGFIVIASSWFYLFMFVSQLLIMISMKNLRERKFVEFSFHLESAFNDFMRDPSKNGFQKVENLQSYFKSIKRGTSISGFTNYTLIWFIGITFIQFTIIGVYFFLVINDIWIETIDISTPISNILSQFF